MPRKTDIFVDTAGWGNYLDQTDPLHKPTMSVIGKIIKGKRHLITTNYVLAELVVLLTTRYHLPRPTVIRSVNAIKSDPNVEIIHITPELDQQAWAMLEQYADKAWSLVDATSFVVMRQYGLTDALTTDQHFTQAGFTRLPAISSCVSPLNPPLITFRYALS